MKLSSVLSLALVYSSCCAALDPTQDLTIDKRTTGTCSIGLGRVGWRTIWDVTIYNVAQVDRQDVNIIATQKNVQMDKGQNATIPSPAGDITITNVDNAPVFTYDEPVLVAPISDPENGYTKTVLNFDIPSAKVNFTTENCGAGNVIWSAGRESWTCDFPCSIAAAVKEL